MTLALLITILAASVQVQPAGQHDAAPVPPGALTLTITSAGDRLCAPDHPTGVTEARFVLHFTNATSVPLLVRPDTSVVAHAQVVQTVEEFIPMGANTDGVDWIMPPGVSPASAPYLLAPGARIGIPHALRIVLRRHAAETWALEPGHYFLELVGVLQVAPAGTGSADAFRPVSVVSPYVEIEIGAPASRCGGPAAG